MKTHAKRRTFLASERPSSFEEREVLFVIEKFLEGLARKDADILQSVLSEDAEIQLLRNKNVLLGKNEYIRLVTKDAAQHYRNDFQFRDVIIDSLDNWVLVRGIFEFAHNLHSHFLCLKIILKQGWLIRRVFYEN